MGSAMKIGEARQRYQNYRQSLTERTRTLTEQRNAAQRKAKLTGGSEYTEAAATLELSIRETQEKLDANRKVLDALNLQRDLIMQMESTKQQSETSQESTIEVSKLMEVARRIASGAKVPYKDERKLMEYNPKLYEAVKNAAALHNMTARKRKKYDSLWEDDDERKTKYTDPAELADNTEVGLDIALPEIPEETGEAAASGE